MAASDALWATFSLTLGATDASAGFPDIEAIVAQWLRDSSLAVGQRVYTTLPGDDPTFPLILVRRTGGLPAVRVYLDAADIQIDVWGTSKSEAHDIAQAARAAALQLENVTTVDPQEAYVSAVEDQLGIAWLPDPSTARDRYVFALTFYYRGPTATEAGAVGYGEGDYGVGGYGD